MGLVNPHDIMWFPLDQPWFWEREPDYVAQSREKLDRRKWGRATNLPAFTPEIERWCTELPENFSDDLHTKPEVHRRWLLEMERTSTPGPMDPGDRDLWLRQLDYYVKLHQLSDQCLAVILAALDDIDQWDNTVVAFTSDHGDQCGSHGLRSKGPWNYEETMRIPLYLSAPGLTTAGTATESLTCHTDLAATILELAGVDASDLPGQSLASAVRRPVVGGSRPHPVRPAVALVHGSGEGALRLIRGFRRAPQVLPLLRHRRRGQQLRRIARRLNGVRARRRLRRP